MAQIAVIEKMAMIYGSKGEFESFSVTHVGERFFSFFWGGCFIGFTLVSISLISFWMSINLILEGLLLLKHLAELEKMKVTFQNYF